MLAIKALQFVCTWWIDCMGLYDANVTFRSISALSWLDGCTWLYTWSSTV